MSADHNSDSTVPVESAGPSASVIRKRRIMGLLVALLVFGLDQWSKSYVVNVLNLREVREIYITPFFNLTWAQNFGISFGMFTAETMETRWILVGITGLIALGVTIWMMRERNWWDIIPLALILGGALGNIRDRYRLGYVVDFADLHFGDFRPFLIFNIADSAISIGVVLLIIRAFVTRDKNRDAEKDTNQMQGQGEPAVENENA